MGAIPNILSKNNGLDFDTSTSRRMQRCRRVDKGGMGADWTCQRDFMSERRVIDLITSRLTPQTVIEFEDNGVLLRHPLLVEPSVRGIVLDLVGFVDKVRVDNVHGDEIFAVDGPEVAERQGAVFHGRGRYWPPHAVKVRSANLVVNRSLVDKPDLMKRTRPCIISL